MGVTAPDIAQIPMSAELATTLARGAELAGATGATEVSLEHLLTALCDDPEAVAVFDASQINPERIKGDLISRILQNPPHPAPPPESLGISLEVRRILEAAAAAARGSRRRDINGAIVLAAIVGDARSVAAQILEAHGLTFENAIRALQVALSPPREAPAQLPPVAEDVLARARERVQSRSAPSLREIMKDMPRPAPPPAMPMPEIPAGHAPETADPQFAPPAPVTPQAEPYPSGPDNEPGMPPAEAEVEAEPAPPATDFRPTPAPYPAEQPRHEPHPSAAADQPAPPPAGPFAAPPEQPQQRREPAPPRGWDRPLDAPAENPAAPGFRPEPSLPLPPHPSAQPAPRQEPRPRQEAHPFPPYPAGPSPVPGVPREIYADLPPRPQPSRVQPPPIPSAGPGAGYGGAGQAIPRGPGPAQVGLPQLGPARPGAPHNTQPGPAPGNAMGPPGPRPGLAHDAGGRGGPAAGPANPQLAQTAPRPARKRAKAASIEAGQLAENIPRTMRVGKTVRAEVRIAKASITALTEGMDGGGQVWQHAVAITKAMSVRIRAPDGGFYIESASPETQWIEGTLGYASDDFASWRFLITPQSRGWSDLQIIVSARTVGADGVAAETALPDQIIEVKVRANIGRALARLFGWTVAAVVGGALAKFGDTGMTIATALLKKFGH